MRFFVFLLLALFSFECSALPPKKSVEELTKACEAGSGRDCFDLGISIMESEDRDLLEADKLTEKACNLNDCVACEAQAVLHKNKDSDKAKNYSDRSLACYQKKCSSRDGESCECLGDIYHEANSLRQLPGYEKSNSKALGYFEKGCALNFKHSCFELGNMYQKGEGTAKSETKARQFYEKALKIAKKECEQNDAEICYGLGIGYETGRDDVSQSYSDAAYYYQKACDGGVYLACLKLGVFYKAGQGVPMSQQNAAKCFEKVCSAESEKSNRKFLEGRSGCYELGLLHESGDTQDYEKAKNYYEKGCTANNGDACYKLGRFYYDGQGVPQSYSEAAEYLQKACTGSAKYSCSLLGSMYEQGLGVPQSEESAISRYWRACVNGDGDSYCIRAGEAYEAKKQAYLVKPLYKKACELENETGCLRLGLLYFEGKSGIPNRQEAKTYLEKACELGSGDGCSKLVKLFSTSLVSQEKEKLLEKACGLDSGEGCSLLAEMYRKGEGVTSSTIKAMHYSQKACDLDDAYGCAQAAMIYNFRRKIKMDETPFVKNIAVFEKACQGNYLFACNTLAIEYRKGDEVRLSFEKAKEFSEKSCSQEDGEGCYILANLYRNGEGVQKSDEMAHTYFGRACDYGYKDGCKEYADRIRASGK